MKTIKITILLTLIFSTSLSAQNFSKVDATVKQYPKKFSKTEKLADLINNDFQNDVDKARAIYTWIALNVRYDLDLYYSPKAGYTFTYSTPEEKLEKEMAYENELAKTTLKKKKAVCAGYACLFNKLCELTDLECVVINGTSKTTRNDIGKLPDRTDHAWNAVKINNEWKLIDVTWGAGIVDYVEKKFIAKYDDFYFMTPPELFFLKHYPNDEKWLLVNKSKEEFQNLPLYYPDYFKSGITINEPTNGIITKAPKKQIKFTITPEVDGANIKYLLGNGKALKSVEIKNKKGTTSFYIPLNKRKSGYLNIYYKNKGMATYKLKIQ